MLETNFNQNKDFLFQENAFENAVCKMAAIFLTTPYVNSL